MIDLEMWELELLIGLLHEKVEFGTSYNKASDCINLSEKLEKIYVIKQNKTIRE